MYEGARGTLRQWTMEDGTVLTSREDFEGALTRLAARGGSREEWEFNLLCDALDHMGQRGVLVEYHPDDSPLPSLIVRFEDGVELPCWYTDCHFD